MIDKVKAVAFCENCINMYKRHAHIDYLVCGDSIKIFFYFKSNNSTEQQQYGDLVEDLNSSLISFKFMTMCDFYMKLIPVKRCIEYDLFWVFLSFDVAGDYYVQKHFWK